MYEHYKTARDKAWEVLIEINASSLPIDLSQIADFYDIEIVSYSKAPITTIFKDEVVDGDGFITKINKNKFIFFNDKISTKGRRRFTIAHELGHGIMNHPLNEIIFRNNEDDALYSEPLELQANVFARDILAPACVLDALGLTTADEIAKICDISEISAKIRLERLQELQQRGKFGVSPLERKVLQQFSEFIELNHFK